MAPAVTRLVHEQMTVVVEELGDDRRRVELLPTDPDRFVPIRSCETSYPLELIESMLEHGSAAFLCAEIVREESESYLRLGLRHYLLSYLGEEEFDGATILDFGCGAGASTIVLARMFPTAAITAIGHSPDLLAIAEQRARLLQVPRVRFALAEDRAELPEEIGSFRFVVLSGVYEHLLPDVRARVMPKLWRALEPGGVLFVNQTPNRLYPLEAHTTNLPLVNYLPDTLAWRFVRRFSKRLAPGTTWESLLRGGIRGTTRGALLRSIGAPEGEATFLRPARLGLHDEADLWYAVSMARNPHGVKRVFRSAFKLARPLAGGDLVPILHVAIRKRQALPDHHTRSL